MWLWLFIASAVLNLFSLFYVRWLLSSLAVINTDIENVTVLIQDFSTHLLQINEMEMFYGDETLKSLIDHSATLIETLENIELLLNENEEEKIAEESPTETN